MPKAASCALTGSTSCKHGTAWSFLCRSTSPGRFLRVPSSRLYSRSPSRFSFLQVLRAQNLSPCSRPLRPRPPSPPPVLELALFSLSPPHPPHLFVHHTQPSHQPPSPPS